MLVNKTGVDLQAMNKKLQYAWNQFIFIYVEKYIMRKINLFLTMPENKIWLVNYAGLKAWSDVSTKIVGNT